MADLTKNWEDELLIVIVLYELKLEDTVSFRSLSKEMNRATFFIYDNSPQPQLINVNTSQKIIVQQNPDNPGVSKAYNEGYRFAVANEKKWLLLCDQDTTFPENILKSFKEVIVNNPTQQLFIPLMRDELGIVSPFRFRWGRGSRIRTIEPSIGSLKRFKFINSGLLISTSLFGRSGGYDECFPLDFSDLAFIEKVKKHYSTFVLVHAFCEHHLASSEHIIIKSLSRFRKFVGASRLYGRIYGPATLLSLQRFLRALKLSFRYGKFDFIRILLQKETN